jgi:hypothetical protein
VPDNGDVRTLSDLRQGLLDGDNNSCLSIRGRLPAPDPLLRLRDERVDGRRELVLGKEARRRSVVFAEIRDDALAAEPKPVSQNLRGIARLRSLLAKMWLPVSPKGGLRLRACGLDRAR